MPIFSGHVDLFCFVGVRVCVCLCGDSTAGTGQYPTVAPEKSPDRHYSKTSL